uniref:Plastid light harvesting protein n=1 Tax=Odontella aurita TaxID=265563 RepID=A0A7S4NGP1_9STRA
MKTAAICALALASSAAAFAPASSQKATTALEAAPFANEIGAQAPLGYYDPLGLCTDGNQANFDRLRYTEIKHGRVAMLAVVGYLVTYAGVRFPGCEDIPAGFAAWEKLPIQVWVQMGFTWSMMEAVNRDAFGLSEFPGDFRNGALDFGWDKQTDAWKRNKRSIELNNGRAAQMGILGLMVHEQLGNVDKILPFSS